MGESRNDGLFSEAAASGDAAVHAARTRLRPILMTSFSFILGVAPLAVATGAGAEMRQSLGTAVLFGMLGVTCFGLLFTPAFYTFIRKLGRTQEAFLGERVGQLPVKHDAAKQVHRPTKRRPCETASMRQTKAL